MLRRGSTRGWLTNESVLPVAMAMVCASVAFRAWMLFPSWFFLDDFNFLTTGVHEDLSVESLLTPYNGNLMPGGLLVAWGVAHLGPVNWPAVATWALLTHAAAAIAAAWMLVVLFGRRPLILVPLALFLTSAMATPTTIWWAVSLNGLPLQVAYFVAIGAWVHYLRSGRRRWLAVCLLAVAGGLFFWVKAILIIPVLAYLSVAYFAQGPLWRRVVAVPRQYPLAVLAGLGLAVGYVAIYLTHTPDQSNPVSSNLAADLAGTMVGKAFATTAVGGPWLWAALAPPTAVVDPPVASVVMAWVAIVLVIAYLALRRTNTLRAWVLVLGYVGADYLLLLTSRAPSFGSFIGLELRYVADALIIVVLAVGLATMPLLGSLESSDPRPAPLLTTPAPRWSVVALMTLVCVGGVVSSYQYANFWHHDNAARDYMLRVKAQLDERGQTDFVSQIAPEDVFSQLAAPANNTDRFLPLLSGQARFPDTSDFLVMIDPEGGLRRAVVEQTITSPTGPIEGCGWKATSRGRTIPLSNETFAVVLWVRIGYLASESSPVTITLGDTTYETSVRAGLNDLYLRVADTFDEVAISGLDESTTVCVDRIDVGDMAVGAPLE